MGGLNINRRRFMITGSVGFTVLAALIALLCATGTVFAALPFAGIGGFTVEADEITGTGFELIPAVTDVNQVGGSSEGSTKSLWPAAQNYLETTTIRGLCITKEVDISKLGLSGSKCLIQVKASGEVTGSGVLMYLTSLEAKEASFTSLEMDENMPVSNPHYYTDPANGERVRLTPESGAEIGQKAPEMKLVEPKITCHYMKNDQITIPGMSVELSIV